jgi:hypothetical protein
LEHRGGGLESEGDEADLAEIERQVRLEHGINRHDQRLDHIVQHVTDADGGKHGDRGPLRGVRDRLSSCVDHHGSNLLELGARQTWPKPCL